MSVQLFRFHILGCSLALLASAALITTADARGRKESECTVTPAPSPIARDAVLQVRVKKNHFCLHRYHLAHLQRANLRPKGFADRGQVVSNGEDTWGYQAPSTAGSDRFTVAVGGRFDDGRLVSNLLTYEITVTD